MASRDARVSIRVPDTLKQWAVGYAKEHNTTVTALVTRFLTRLHQEDAKRQADAEQV
jgi:Holliday junction resolvasome RuvABC endonuclease subunit